MVPLYSCTRVLGCSSSEWVQTKVPSMVSIRLRSVNCAVTPEATVMTPVRSMTLMLLLQDCYLVHGLGGRASNLAASRQL